MNKIMISVYMKAFYYLNYFIYRFYENRDPDPFIYSLNGSSLLIVLNFMTFYYGISYFWMGVSLSLDYWVGIIAIAIIFANYLILYKGEKYIEVFNEYRIIDNHKQSIFCVVYIIVSIVGYIS